MQCHEFYVSQFYDLVYRIHCWIWFLLTCSSIFLYDHNDLEYNLYILRKAKNENNMPSPPLFLRIYGWETNFYFAWPCIILYHFYHFSQNVRNYNWPWPTLSKGCVLVVYIWLTWLQRYMYFIPCFYSAIRLVLSHA